MKTSIILKEERSDIISQLENIKDAATTEERDLTSEENDQVDGLLTEIDNLDSKIVRAEKIETIKRNAAVVSGVTATKKDKDLEKFTFQGAVRAAYTGELNGIYKEMDQEARDKARYTGQNYRGIAIPSSVLTRAQDYVDTANQNSVRTMTFVDQLENNLVLASAGCNFYSGVENMKFPVIQGITSAFQPETGGTEADGTGNTTNLVLSPKKIISIVNVSQESMVQNASLEAALQRNMSANIAATIEDAFLREADVTNAPESMVLDATSSGTGTIDAAAIVKMETDTLGAKVALEGARMAYIMNTSAYGSVKALPQVSNVSPIWDNNDKRLNGYFGFVSGNMTSDQDAGKGSLLFGDFSKVHVAQFGGIDLLFDPYTYSGVGVPRLVMTSLVDAKAAQAATFHKHIKA